MRSRPRWYPETSGPGMTCRASDIVSGEFSEHFFFSSIYCFYYTILSEAEFFPLFSRLFSTFVAVPSLLCSGFVSHPSRFCPASVPLLSRFRLAGVSVPARNCRATVSLRRRRRGTVVRLVGSSGRGRIGGAAGIFFAAGIFRFCSWWNRLPACSKRHRRDARASDMENLNSW